MAKTIDELEGTIDESDFLLANEPEKGGDMDPIVKGMLEQLTPEQKTEMLIALVNEFSTIVHEAFVFAKKVRP